MDPENFQIEPPILESMLEFPDAQQDDLEYYPSSEGPVDIPEDSVVDTESSDGSRTRL